MNTVKISTAGFGYMGKLHTMAYKSMPIALENFNYNIVLHKLLSNRDIPSEISGYKERVCTLEELSDTDILDICSPNFAHEEQINTAVNMGIANIYCEKPLTGFTETEEALVKLTKEKKLNTQMGLVLRFLPAVIRAKKLIEEGEIGDVINFNCHMYHQSYLNPQRPMSWRLEKEKSGGGAFVDLGVHMVDLIHYILGPITDIVGYVKTYIKERPQEAHLRNVDVDDFAHMDLTVRDRIPGTLEVSRVAAGKGEDTGFEIFGTKGSIKIHTSNPDYPTVYSLKDSTFRVGSYLTYKEVEKDISLIYPSSKYSLGWMVNCHLASLYSFISKTQGKAFDYISLPTFEASLQAMKIIERGYNSL